MNDDKKSERVRRKPGRQPAGVGSAEDTRREIVAQAMSLFHTRGFGAISVDDIAAAAGVTKPTLYYHFSGKGEIYSYGVVQMAQGIHGHVATIAAQTGRTVYERLRQMLGDRRAMINQQAIIAWNEAMMDEAMTYLSAEQQSRIKEAVAALHQPLRGLMAEGIASGELRPSDPDLLAVAFRQLVQPTTYHSLPGRDGAEVDAGLLELFYRGVATEGVNG